MQAATDGRPISDAWSDEPWVIDGAAVRVSLVCFSGAARLGQPIVTGISIDLQNAVKAVEEPFGMFAATTGA